MSDKIGRNDPCPCGSGKKYKQCCINKDLPKPTRRKLKAVWVNQPVHETQSANKAQPAQEAAPAQENEPVNLIERTYGAAIASSSKAPPSKPKHESHKTDDSTESEREE
jgi:uncharacterized protein